MIFYARLGVNYQITHLPNLLLLPLPPAPILRVFHNNPGIGELLADGVRAGKIAGFFGGVAFFDQAVYFGVRHDIRRNLRIFKDAVGAGPVHSGFHLFCVIIFQNGKDFVELLQCFQQRRFVAFAEFAAIGQPWLDHDERYRRSEEFIRALRGIWTEDTFTYKGFFYHFDNYSLKPKPIEPLPEIFQGGSSRAARDMASRVSDWYFTNGNTPEEIAKQVDDIQAKAAQNGHSVRVGVNAFAIARDTEAEAKAVLAEIIQKANPEAVHAFAHEVKNAGKASPEGQGNWAKSTFDDLVQYNDGFRSNLIGTPRQIAERILALKDAGASLILLGFLHFQEEVEYFGKHVIPLVRELEERRSAALAAA